MRLQPTIVALGGASWRVRPLTVAQVQEIEPLLEAQASAQGGGSIRSAIAILRVALGRDHPEAAEGLDAIEAGAGEIAAAMSAVLRLGGFLEAAPGEADADRPPAIPGSTGPRSTPA